MKRISRLFGAVSVLLAASIAIAANHYVLPAPGSGTKSGSDWANACAGFTGSCAAGALNRGDTYYVGAGSYPTINFNTPESGASVITIKKAVTSDHGTATGWQGFYTNQSSFGYITQVSTGYWLFDGQVGDQAPNSETTYGFLVQSASCPPVDTQGSGAFWIADVSNVTVQYMAIVMCGPNYDIEQQALAPGQGSNVNVRHTFVKNAQNSLTYWHTTNSYAEYNYFQDQWSSPAHHGESINFRYDSYLVIRYNVIDGCAGTACMAANNPEGTGVPMDHIDIYGNVFLSDTSGDGILHANNSMCITNTNLYNNTFVRSGPIVSTNPGSCASSGVVENNLVYNSSGSIDSQFSHDYNAFFQATSAPSEAHGQTGSSNPLVNPVRGGSFALTGATSTGLTLSSSLPSGCTVGLNCYNIDPDGTTRLTSAWDRGAYQYSTSTANVTPPSGLIAVVQ
jgi:hypothetical protein